MMEFIALAFIASMLQVVQKDTKTYDQNKHDNLIRIVRAACTRIITDLENSKAYHAAQVSKMREDNEKALAEAVNDVRQTFQDIDQNKNENKF